MLLIEKLISSSLVSFSSINMIAYFLQSVSPTDNIIPSIEKVTLTGALISAVIVLWKSVTKKDEIVIAATKTTTEALIAVANASQELRKIVDKQVDSNENLHKSIDQLCIALAGVRCLNDDPPVKTSANIIKSVGGN